MKGELKAGGLAIIYGLVGQVNENGKCVELVRMLHASQFFTPPGSGKQETVDPKASGPVWLVQGRVSPVRNGQLVTSITGWALYYPRNLMPIDDADPDAVDQRERDLVAS